MKVKMFYIGSIPTLLIGKKSEKVFLFVHGLHGRKEEALPFAEVVVPKGYQVLGIDLPVERMDRIVSEEVGHDFISQHQCQVTMMADGEHWFHTPQQLKVLRKWEEDMLIMEPDVKGQS